jgi:hypothetical protein
MVEWLLNFGSERKGEAGESWKRDQQQSRPQTLSVRHGEFTNLPTHWRSRGFECFRVFRFNRRVFKKLVILIHPDQLAILIN